MRTLAVCCVLVASSVSWGNEVRENFLQNLPSYQKNLLNDFLLSMAQTECGYVLYGDKPMHLITCDLSPLRIVSGANPESARLLKGVELWKDLNLSADKEFLITSFEKNEKCHILCINRKAFLNKVNSNLSLFRYILGPTVTPEKLLQEITASNDKFEEVLKQSTVLLNILLGSGTQNAMMSSRYQEISSFGQRDEFPYISEKMKASWNYLSPKLIKKPSLGYRSVVEEEYCLEQMLTTSDQIKSYDTCQIPQFICRTDTKETQELLSSYEESRKKILKAITAKNFMSDLLTKLFTNVWGGLELPSIPQKKSFSLPQSKEEIALRLVGIIRKSIGGKSKKYLRSFMEGVAASEKNQRKPTPRQWRRTKEIAFLEKELLSSTNLQKADQFFQKLKEKNEFQAIADGGAYYKVVKEGDSEKIASNQIKNVSFQYSMQVLGEEKSREFGIVKKENPSALIPGLALALVGMKVGEERLVYIHPRYAYGEECLLDPNLTIGTQVRLLGFEEGERPFEVMSAHRLEHRDHQDLATRCDVLRCEDFYEEGLEFWDSIKSGHNSIDFGSFQKAFNSYNHNQIENLNSEREFVSDLEFYLISEIGLD